MLSWTTCTVPYIKMYIYSVKFILCCIFRTCGAIMRIDPAILLITSEEAFSMINANCKNVVEDFWDIILSSILHTHAHTHTHTHTHTIPAMELLLEEGKKRGNFFLKERTGHILYGIGQMVKDHLDMVKDHSKITREETRCHHSISYSFRLAAVGILYAPSPR